jgi:2-amino-4-hydroxy-6-hydroxymethyldihydropteridine diphosphokinase
MGPADQPDYVNAVAVLETRLSPWRLLAALQGLETWHGRVRGPLRWGPRSLDLDLLVYGDWRSADPRLTVPHPGIADRPFVLYPLHEVEPELEIPGLAAVRDLIGRLPAGLLEVLG